MTQAITAAVRQHKEIKYGHATCLNQQQTATTPTCSLTPR